MIQLDNHFVLFITACIPQALNEGCVFITAIKKNTFNSIFNEKYYI